MTSGMGPSRASAACWPESLHRRADFASRPDLADAAVAGQEINRLEAGGSTACFRRGPVDHASPSSGTIISPPPTARSRTLPDVPPERHAAPARGHFADLLAPRSEPALLVYLDAPANRKGHPNENLARELMELFTIGVGHFSERDVQEAARALTGWTVDDERFAEKTLRHDDGEKTILGRKGRWAGSDLVRILLDQPATARRIAGKLCRLFFGETALPPDAVTELTTEFRERGLDIGWAVGTILRSRRVLRRCQPGHARAGPGGVRRRRGASPGNVRPGTEYARPGRVVDADRPGTVRTAQCGGLAGRPGLDSPARIDRPGQLRGFPGGRHRRRPAFLLRPRGLAEEIWVRLRCRFRAPVPPSPALRDRPGPGRRESDHDPAVIAAGTARLNRKDPAMLTRRAFLHSSSLLALAPAVPLFVARTARAAPTDRDGRVLVVVQLDGGNDALNTVVPHADPSYAKLRPTLKIRKRDLVRLSDTLGLHPSLKPLEKLLQDGQLAVIPGVGYPNPNRSHFESMAIWHTARFDPEEHKGYGWLGRALDPLAGTSYALGEFGPRSPARPSQHGAVARSPGGNAPRGTGCARTRRDKSQPGRSARVRLPAGRGRSDGLETTGAPRRRS